MAIDWKNATFEFMDSEASNYEPEEQKYSFSKNFQEHNQHLQVKRSRNEFKESAIKLEEFKSREMSNQKAPAIPNNNEGMKFNQQRPQLKPKNKLNSIYVCTTCTIDFPSIAYLDRHQKTKKHLRALGMEERGQKINQKRSYVRKNNYQGNTIAQQVIQEISHEITDLTLEEIQFLHKIDMELIKIESENTAKDFYENFNFDLDFDVAEPATKVQKLSSPEEIYKEIVSYEPVVKEESKILKIVDVRSYARPQIQHPVADTNINDLIFQSMNNNTTMPKIVAVQYARPKIQHLIPRVKIGETSSQNAMIANIRAVQVSALHPVPQASEADEPSTLKDITNYVPIIKEEPIEPKTIEVSFGNLQIQYPVLHASKEESIFKDITNNEQMLKEQPIVPKNVAVNCPLPKIHQIIPQVAIVDGLKAIIQCQLCPKTFNLRCHYTQHMNIAHTVERNFRCEQCGKKFSEQESLQIHLMRHSGDKAFKCNKCEKSYNNKADLVRHDKTHESIRDYNCNVCGKGFIRGDHLQKHLLTHTGKSL